MKARLVDTLVDSRPRDSHRVYDLLLLLDPFPKGTLVYLLAYDLILKRAKVKAIACRKKNLMNS
jgi:hypothetical protein